MKVARTEPEVRALVMIAGQAIEEVLPPGTAVIITVAVASGPTVTLTNPAGAAMLERHHLKASADA